MRHFLSIIGILVGTGACTSVEELRPDMESRPLPSRADEIAYINELREAYTTVSLADRKSVPCYAGEKLHSFRPKYVQGYPDWDPQQDTAAYSGQCLRFKPNPGVQKITSYLESGFGLTDLYCQRYFTVATETRQSRALQRNLVKTGGTLMNAVLAALSGSAASRSISTAAFGAVDSGYGAVDDAFVVAPTRDDVRKLVLSAQQKYRSAIFKKDSSGKANLPVSYASARAAVERYAGLCTFDGMRQLVADAVASKTKALNESAEKPAGNQPKNVAESVKSGSGEDESLVAPPPISPK